MLNFLRNLRRSDKKGKYLKYALGEIFLVMIGILLALALNNWNENRKRDDYEMVLLKEIKNVLERDRWSIDEYYLSRLERKENAVLVLGNMVGKKESISNADFLKLYSELSTDFHFTYDSGPYEALKANGLDRLQNDSLRALLIQGYDGGLPTFKHFIDDGNVNTQRKINTYEKDFIGDQLIESDEGNWYVIDGLKVENILSYPSFISVLKLETWKAENQRDRLSVLIRIIDQLLLTVNNELAKE